MFCGEVEMPNEREHSVGMIETALALLDGERNKLLDCQAQHRDKTRALAFDAHAGDAEAIKLLDQTGASGRRDGGA
jgi:hypothetical protein